MRRLTLFLCLAAAVPAAPPSPESFFGHTMGADRTALDWARVVAYFEALEKSADRIRVRQIGSSAEGRPMIAAFIAAPETLGRLDRYAWIQKKLADPRITPEEEARALAAEGKAVVLITCSIHATEVASSHSAIEFAHRLVTSDAPRVRTILDNAILILAPSINPDGMDLVTAWYRKTLGTPLEGEAPPELYHKYAGHDNNRDWYFFSQPETRAVVSQLHNVWFPQITYDIHQHGPFGSRMFAPPWLDPIDPNIDPILAQEANRLGMEVAADLTAAGKTGVVVHALYDSWSPSRNYAAYHAGVRLLTESASVRIASPIQVQSRQVETVSRGYNPRERSWNYLEPWTGGEWRLRDIVDYQLIAMESVMWQAAVRREDLLRSFYRVGRRAIEGGAPWAFLVPPEQRDPGAARKLFETLRFGLVEIEQASVPFAVNGKNYPDGTWVIRTAQPYSAFAKTLLDPPPYPGRSQYPNGPPHRPYDVTAHALPLLLGVDVERIAEAPDTTLAPAAPPAARPATGALPAGDSDTWSAVNALWAADEPVWRDTATGDFSADASALAHPRRAERPRVGVYRSWVPSEDEGWTRWTLEQFGFAYSSVRNEEIQAGGLRKRYDALIFPDQAAETITHGFRARQAFPEHTGGLGDQGAAALRAFASEGGTLIFLNRSSVYAVAALRLRLRNVVEGLSPDKFFAPGSLLDVLINTGSPLALGAPRTMAVWSEASPAWAVPRNSPARVAAGYPAGGLLASGWLIGERRIAGKAALIDYPIGRGRAVLFGFRPQYRGQSYSAFKLLFNALICR